LASNSSTTRGPRQPVRLDPERFLKVRRLHGKTLEELTETSRVSLATVKRAANGDQISWQSAQFLCEALNVALDDLTATPSRANHEPAPESSRLLRYTTIREYMESRGPMALSHYVPPPLYADADILSPATIDEVRQVLRRAEMSGKVALRAPVQARITGTFFPAGLLSAGWWRGGRENLHSVISGNPA
jgi:transcriptional regulator with XRE-family HTH domain